MGRTISCVERSVDGLGDRVVAALAAAVEALIERDLRKADAVVRGDLEINRLRYAIESDASDRLVSTHDPLEVRSVVATLYVISDLERIGDHAEGIAKVTLMLGPSPRLGLPSVIRGMSVLVLDMVRETLAVFASGDAARARQLCERDDEVDTLYDRAYGELLSQMGSDQEIVNEATYLLWVTHNLERIADRATNICERVVFLVSGTVEELNVSKY